MRRYAVSWPFLDFTQNALYDFYIEKTNNVQSIFENEFCYRQEIGERDVHRDVNGVLKIIPRSSRRFVASRPETMKRIPVLQTSFLWLCLHLASLMRRILL